MFRKGILKSAGEVPVPIELMKGINYTPHRLKFIGSYLRDRFPDAFDLLIIECIYYRINEKTNLKSYQQLNQSIGAITSNLQWNKILNVLPWEWKKLIEVAGIYEKQDVTDAIQIGAAMIAEARKCQ